MARKSWQEKLADDKDLPRVEKITDKMSKRWGEGTFVIPAPREVDEIMREVPEGKLITINQIRQILAKKHNATIACPITTGIFAWIAAHAAEEARAEAMELMRVQNHIRSPRFSGPIIGLTKDCISGIYILTSSERKFSREEFVELIRSTDLDVKIPEKKYMDGKEIFSVFLPKDFSIKYKSRSGEAVIIENGKLVKGVIDKNGIGAEAGKILDKMEREYGKEVTKKFIENMMKLSLEFLTRYGFSVSISDYDLPERTRKGIEDVVEKARKDVDRIIKEFEEGKLRALIGRTPKETLASLIKRRLNKCLDEVETLIERDIKDNPTIVMAKSGARGSMVNVVQSTAMIGQETIMGERVERGYHERTFPHFKPGDISLEAKGFVDRGFKMGLTPFQFFFDAMNSRESLMDKSLKTRHSGYMERRLVGALQDLKVEYDLTVRNSDREIVRFLPGEDGLDPSKIERGVMNVEEIARSIFG